MSCSIQEYAARPVNIIDATLREGNQAPGVRFGVAETIAIARELATLGVDMIECGHPLASAEEAARVRSVVELGLGIPVLAHARCDAKDIDAVAATGAGWVGVVLGINEISRRARVGGWSTERVKRTIADAVRHAHGAGLRVRCTIEDASRTPDTDLYEAFDRALDAGADRICFADTVGILDPAATAARITGLRRRFPKTPIEVHFHNDRGLALANALAAVDAGAEWVSASVNGLGERCGITDLVPLLGNLHFTGNRPLPRGDCLAGISRAVAAFARKPLPDQAPIVGRDAFVHVAPMHRRAIEREEQAYNWINPDIFGFRNSLAPTALPSDVAELINAPLVIPATELRYHRAGPGTRYVMLDQRLVPDCRQYCIVRDIPHLSTAAPGHVDRHSHAVDSLFLFLGREQGSGQRVEVNGWLG